MTRCCLERRRWSIVIRDCLVQSFSLVTVDVWPPASNNSPGVIPLMPGFHHSVAVLPLADNQPEFWSLYPYVYGRMFPAFPFSPATATAATVRKNGNGMVETRHHLGLRRCTPLPARALLRRRQHRRRCICSYLIADNEHKCFTRCQ